MRFGQLIVYRMRNIFLEKSYTKCAGETIPRPLSKKIKIEHNTGSILPSFKQLISIGQHLVFFYQGFLSRLFTIHRIAGEEEWYLFNSSLPFPSPSR